MITLVHNKIKLALHEVSGTGGGRPLLLLHGLGERTPSTVPAYAARWTGPVYGLDFTGHGASTVPAGGGYTAEILMGDTDAALNHIGEATVLGRGLGAYVALLVAGARADAVKGAILADGPGLAGGGHIPRSPNILVVNPAVPAPPDPFALGELSDDLRPPDYAASFARQAIAVSDVAEPIAVCAVHRPEWLKAVLAEVGVRDCSLDEALDMYAG